MKNISYITSFLFAITSVLAHGDGGVQFTPGMNPFEYFAHGFNLYGILVIGLWFLIIYGIYTLAMLVIGRHIK